MTQARQATPRVKAPKRSTFLRHTTMLFMVLAGGLSMVLFSVKYQVHDLEAQQKRLTQELETERRALHVLRAEWANLNDPQRLKQLAEQHLGLKPMGPGQVMDLGGVLAIPVREDEIEGTQEGAEQ